MNELLEAAKAVIERWDSGRGIWDAISDLRAAVERADKPPADFMVWWKTFPLNTYGIVPAFHGWEAGQQAERERIKEIIKYQFGGLVSDLSEVMEMIDEPSD